MLNIPTGSECEFCRSYDILSDIMWIRQTVFYTPDTLTVSQGDKIEGRLSCAPNVRNNRDLDIKIAYRVGGDGTETEVHYKMCVVPPSTGHTFPPPYSHFVIFIFCSARMESLTDCQVLILYLATKMRCVRALSTRGWSSSMFATGRY